MADIISDHDVSDEEIVSLIELLFFAYRDFTSDPDAILSEWGFGRAHHRVVHFVGRNPGMTVAQLLGILGITRSQFMPTVNAGGDYVATRTSERGPTPIPAAPTSRPC